MRTSLYGIRTQKEVEQILRCAAGIEKQKKKCARKRVKYRWGVDPLSIPIMDRLTAHKEWKRELSLKEMERARREKTRITREKNKLSAWPQNKQRRSNIDWCTLVPPDVAKFQIRYERHATVAAMRKSGLKWRVIGEAFGVSVERARQMYLKALRLSQRLSPVERYNLDKDDVVEAPLLGTLPFLLGQSRRRDWLYV